MRGKSRGGEGEREEGEGAARCSFLPASISKARSSMRGGIDSFSSCLPSKVRTHTTRCTCMLTWIPTPSLPPHQARPRFKAMCWKRYTDFRELHAALTRRFPHSGIPDLPPKAMGRMFDESYLRGKQSALNAYLNTLTRIDEVSSSEEFLDFLTDQHAADDSRTGSTDGSSSSSSSSISISSQDYAGSQESSFGAAAARSGGGGGGGGGDIVGGSNGGGGGGAGRSTAGGQPGGAGFASASSADAARGDDAFSISAVRFILQARDKTTVRVGAGKTHEVVSVCFCFSRISWGRLGCRQATAQPYPPPSPPPPPQPPPSPLPLPLPSSTTTPIAPIRR